ncbi:MAG TPA: SRPBCC domain-containing protein [Salinimicrobium sp.]|nr:SRPBCC domain-containing protein [Salinimicrobium sp.]
MKRKQYQSTLETSPEHLWEILWGNDTYPEWTSVFAEGSKAESDWQEGSRIKFLNADNEGMIAVIEKRKEPEIMNFRHIGMIDKDGHEDLESEKVKAFAGASENYTLRKKNGKTELTVEMDVDNEYEDYFDSTWPKVFEILRTLSSKSPGEMKAESITVKTSINAPIDKVWEYWSKQEHVKNWNNASDDWHTPSAENDFRQEGKFSYRMESRDGKNGFDFEGIYDKIEHQKVISYTISDGRKVKVNFEEQGNTTLVEEIFEPENTYPIEMQKEGWQNIMNNFKKYVEQN